MLGYNFTDSLEGSEGSLINFNESPASVSYFPFFPEVTLGTGLVSISDGKKGELQFYSNGCAIFDKSHQIMMNGNDLNPGKIHDEFCKKNAFFYPNAMGMIALPDFKKNNGYYLIHSTIRDENNQFTIRDTLRYSYINMNVNNGLGEVTIKNEPIYNQWLDSGLNACQHDDGESWWIVNLHNEKNTFAKFLLKEEGIAFRDTQSIGSAPTPRGYQGSFSPIGNRYAWYGGQNELNLFDFDRTNGIFSNYRQIYISDTIDHGGLAFSPSGRFIYCTTASKIYQVDLENPLGSDNVQEVAARDLPPIGSFSGSFSFAILGPDCRIYITSRNGIKYLTTIDYPDIKGVDCTVKQYDFELPYYNSIFSIPNNPHYRIDEPYPCSYNTDVIDYDIASKLEIAPNPATNILIVKSKTTSPYVIYDIRGSLKLQGMLNRNSTDIDISALSSGMYVIIAKETNAHAKFIKI